MISIFTPSSNDQSIYYLQQLFGNVGTVLPLGSNIQSTSPLLGTMFMVLNTALLTIGAFIIIYVTIVGVLKTAQEGEPMGKQWNSLWVPLRLVIGIASLVPSTAGYCALQIIMMWIIVQGIGAADNLWHSTLKWVEINGSPIAGLQTASNNPQTVAPRATFGQLFQSLVCQEAATLAYTNPQGVATGGYYCAPPATGGTPAWCGNVPSVQSSTDATQATSTYTIGPQSGVCGSLSFCNSSYASAQLAANPSDPGSQLANAACTGQLQALQSLVPALSSLALLVAQSDYQYWYFYYNSYNLSAQGSYQPPAWIKAYCSAQGISQCCVPSSNPNIQGNCQGNASSFPAPNDSSSPNNATSAAMSMYWTYAIQPQLQQAGFQGSDFIGQAVTAYTAAIANQTAPIINAIIATAPISNSTLNQADTLGWIMAGAYYFNIASMTNNALASAQPPFAASGSSPPSTYNYQNDFLAAQSLVSNANQQAGSGGSFSQASAQFPGMSSLTGAWSGAVTGIMNNFIGSTKPGGAAGNPLVNIQMFGEQILTAVYAVFAVTLVLSLIMGIVGFVTDFFVLGNGDISPLGPTLMILYMLIVPVLLAFMGAFLSFGGMMAVYTPLIPYMVFTFGAIGWLFATVEAMTAGPLVAIGIMLPGGHHEILGRAEKALGLIFSIFLRPSLMIFGMMAAMLLSVVVITLINSGFYTVMVTISSSPGLIESVFFIGIYVTFVITALNKCFSLIHIIPERVMTWIGEQAVSYGEAEGLAKVERGAEAAGSGAAGAATKGGEAPMTAAKAGAHKHKKTGGGSMSTTP